MAEEKPIRQSRDERFGPAVRNQNPLAPPLIPAPHTRKAHIAMILMKQSISPRPRRLRAAIIAVGLDGGDDQHRLTHGDQCLIFGGSEETHAELQETALRMERELDRSGRLLGDLDPAELAELAMIIDSPELHEIALRLKAGLEQQGRAFEDMSPEELTALSAPAH
ncbi:MAG TPA: hypothetical protein VKA15_26690 [Isosphaeraceae bacterium]|nr:hypothetical protein [Isosphaeraceae bacterium]